MSNTFKSLAALFGRKPRYLIAILTAGLLHSGVQVAAGAEVASKDQLVSLLGEDGLVSERVLEALLAPGEFPGRRFEHISAGDEALYSLDSSLGSAKPFAELHPERLSWPVVAGLELVVEGPGLKIAPASKEVNDDTLDRGFAVRWILSPLGQRFDPVPYFAVEVVEAEVISARDGTRLFHWSKPLPPPLCHERAARGRPNCEMRGLGLEALALAVSPDGTMLAVAHGGLRPRLEVYDIEVEPRFLWQALFSTASGGVVEAAFSYDGQWVVALTGRGRMHRFFARSGGKHLGIRSAGRAARSIPPGRIMAVAGEQGEVNLWYLSDGTIAWRLPPRKLRGPIDRLAASGDGRRFATLEYDDESTVVRVWEVRRRQMLAQIAVDPYAVVDIALDEKGQTLLVSHEKRGLLAAVVEKQSEPEPVDGRHAERCRGRLQWIPGRSLLSCAVPTGALRLDLKGRLKGELSAGGPASDWIVATSAEGRRLAAVGSGRLLIWWTE